MCAASTRLSTTTQGKRFIIDNDPTINSEIADKLMATEHAKQLSEGEKYIFDIDMNSKLLCSMFFILILFLSHS